MELPFTNREHVGRNVLPVGCNQSGFLGVEGEEGVGSWEREEDFLRKEGVVEAQPLAHVKVRHHIHAASKGRPRKHAGMK